MVRTVLVNSIDPFMLSEKYRSKEPFKSVANAEWFEENKKPPYKFELAFPYVNFIMVFNSNMSMRTTKVYFRLAPFRSMDDYLLIPPINNLGTSQDVCIGNNDVFNIKNYSGASEMIDHYVSTFWNAPFNTDYHTNMQKYAKSPYLCDYFLWQHNTRTNPMFIFNADWQSSGRTLGKLFGQMVTDGLVNERGGGGRSPSRYFDQLYELFKNPSSGNKVKDPETGRMRQTTENAIDSAFISPGLCVHLGDNIILRNGKIAILETIITESGKTFPYSLNFVCEGKILKFQMTTRNIKLLKDAYSRKTTLKEVQYDGKTLRVGDLIKFKSVTTFGDFATVISDIRKNIEGRVEIGIPGYGNYFLDSLNLKGCELLNKDDFMFNEVHIFKAGTYEYSTRPSQKPFNNSRPIRYIELKHDDSGSVVVRFQDINNDDKFNISLGDLKQRIFEVNEKTVKRNIGTTFRFGNCLKRTSKDAFAIDGRVEFTTLKDYSAYTFQKDTVLDFTGKDKLVIPGIDYDTVLSVGEKVLIVDQENPLEMMNIKTVMGFRASDDKRLLVLLEDKNKIASAVDIIHGQRVYPERFRKVTNKIDDLSVGMKIVAKEPYIYMFPKKDVNIIVAFIIDQMREPLVFLSNGLTLWLSDVKSKFTVIPMTSKKWKKMAHSPIINEFKLQPGDVIAQQDPTMPEYVHCNTSRVLTSYACDDYANPGNLYPWTLYSKKYIRGGRNVKLLSVPLPRFSTALNDETLEFTTGFPTPYGIIPCTASGFYYPVINGKIGG
jgi:hypothetical protein